MEQYIRDKYEFKRFANPGSPMGPMHFGTASGASRPSVSATRTSFATELQQLSDMGFSDRGKCMRALESAHGNIADSIDILAASKSPVLVSLPKSDPYADLLSGDMSGLSLGKTSGHAMVPENNGWTDLEFSKPADMPFEPVMPQGWPQEVRRDSSMATSPIATQAQRSSSLIDEEPFSAQVVTPAASSAKLPVADPWAAPSSGTGLGAVLGSAKLFPGDDDDDPFKEITHNPFK